MPLAHYPEMGGTGIYVCLNCGHRLKAHGPSGCEVLICDCKEFVLDPANSKKPR